jgi:hypothetical protein
MLCGGALYAAVYPFMKAHIIGIIMSKNWCSAW